MNYIKVEASSMDELLIKINEKHNYKLVPGIVATGLHKALTYYVIMVLIDE